MPVLPLHLNETLGLGTLVIGLVVGLQFVVALLSRAWAGNLAELLGTKRAVVIGCLLAAGSDVVYLASLAFIATPTISVWVVVLGRILPALGENLIATGALGWSLGLVGPQNADKVMVYVGIAIYGANTLGAPLRVALNTQWGFAAVVVVIPFMALAVVAGMRTVAPAATKRTPFYSVLGFVLWPGIGLALSSAGFGLIAAFIALLFVANTGATFRLCSLHLGWLSSVYAFSSDNCRTRWGREGGSGERRNRSGRTVVHMARRFSVARLPRRGLDLLGNFCSFQLAEMRKGRDSMCN